jgi:hypothetical protein
MAKQKSVLYASATSGQRARDEIRKILRRLGCDEIGFMDLYEEQALAIYFLHRGRHYQLKASAKGWAQMYIRANPWNSRRRDTRQEYEQKALHQGYIAINSMLRDMIKGQMGVIEAGVLSFEAVFLPFMLTHSGETVHEHVSKDANLLPPPAASKVVDIR